eukprot:351138-Chlamydomonas_euryale.AAC.14
MDQHAGRLLLLDYSFTCRGRRQPNFSCVLLHCCPMQLWNSSVVRPFHNMQAAAPRGHSCSPQNSIREGSLTNSIVLSLSQLSQRNPTQLGLTCMKTFDMRAAKASLPGHAD